LKTSIEGKLGIKFFWGCAYSSKQFQPVQRLFKIGRLKCYIVVKPKYSPFDKGYYKPEVRNLLSKYFEVRWEPACGTGDNWWAAYSHDGGYIGSIEDVYRLFQDGITIIQKSDPEHNVCSIGFNQSENKWYGWSHRAMFGFGIGSIVKDGDCCASSGWVDSYLEEHPEKDRRLPVGFEAKTLDDAKRMAIAFADSVS